MTGPFVQCKGIGGKTPEMALKTNRRIWERPDAGSRAVRSMFVNGPEPTRIAVAWPFGPDSRSKGCEANSKKRTIV